MRHAPHGLGVVYRAEPRINGRDVELDGVFADPRLVRVRQPVQILDGRLHLRFPGQPALGRSQEPDQGRKEGEGAQYYR